LIYASSSVTYTTLSALTQSTEDAFQIIDAVFGLFALLIDGTE